MDNTTIEAGKPLAIVSYLTIIGTIIAFYSNNETKNPFTLFHVKQALGLWLTFFLLGYFIGYLNSLNVTFAFWIAIGSLIIYGLIGAISGKLNSVPVLGPFYQKLFKSLGN